MARKLSRRTVAQYVADRLLAGDNAKKLSQLVAAYLIDTRRTSELQSLLDDIAVSLAERGHVNGTVTVAHTLSSDSKRAIEAFIKEKTGATSVDVATKIDPTVLGGFRLSLPGSEVDATIAHQLAILKTRYKKA